MNDNEKRISDQGMVGDVQPCCDGGDCCPSGSESGGKSWKLLVFLIIVVAAGVVLARSIMNKSDSTTDQTQPLFTTDQLEVSSDTPSSPNVESPDKSKAGTVNPTTAIPTATELVSGAHEPTLWGKPLISLASLNQVAVDTDAVFIFLASEDKQQIQPVTSEIEAAAKKIQSNGTRITAFTLEKSAPEYAQLVKQFPVPCVLAMVKGRGMSGVTGEINEAKLLQAFVGASRATSSCCPPGTDPSVCVPLRPK